MRASLLDFRARKEARHLVREARAALAIKRVIATAGDSVETRCGVLYVNGVAVPDEFVDQESYRDYDEDRDLWRTHLSPVARYHEITGGHAHDVYGDGTIGHAEGELQNFPGAEIRPNLGRCVPQPDVPPVRQVLGRIEPDTHEIQDGCSKPHVHYVVPPGHIFAMGDNRDNSNDSRAWGSVPLENVKGKALFIWLSYGQFGVDGGIGLSHERWQDYLTWLRFARIGNFVE
jgi:signal peptidase I